MKRKRRKRKNKIVMMKKEPKKEKGRTKIEERIKRKKRNIIIS